MIIAITGKPGIGKTTVIKKIIEKLQNKAIGFYTQEIRNSRTRKRLGFEVITTDGQRSILAQKFKEGKYKVGSYTVDVENFEKIVIPLLEKALEEKDKVIVIDEVGKMELLSKKFQELLKKLLSKNDAKIILTVPIKDVHPIVKEIKNRPDVKIIELTLDNRDTIPSKILEKLNER